MHLAGICVPARLLQRRLACIAEERLQGGN